MFLGLTALSTLWCLSPALDSYFSKSNSTGHLSQYDGSATSSSEGLGEGRARAPPSTGLFSVGGTPPLGARGTDSGYFKRSLFSPTTSGVFGSGAVGPRFGESEDRSGRSLAPRGIGLLQNIGQGLTSLSEKEEDDMEHLPEA